MKVGQAELPFKSVVLNLGRDPSVGSRTLSQGLHIRYTVSLTLTLQLTTVAKLQL